MPPVPKIFKDPAQDFQFKKLKSLSSDDEEKPVD